MLRRRIWVWRIFLLRICAPRGRLEIFVLWWRGEESYLKWRVLIEAVPRRILFGDSRAARAQLFSARLFPTLWMSHADPIMLLPAYYVIICDDNVVGMERERAAASHNKPRSTFLAKHKSHCIFQTALVALFTIASIKYD